MKKGLSITAALLLTASLASGCAGLLKRRGAAVDEGTQTGQPEINLSYMGYKSETLNVKAIENAIEGFMSEHPECSVSYEGVKGTPYWETLEKKNESGQLDDLFMVDHDRVLKLEEQNKLENLSDIESVSNYGMYASSQFTNKDGSVYFLPTCIITYGLYCNIDLLRKNGFEPPKNLNEFTEICDYFLSEGVTPIIANNYASIRTLIVAKGMYSVYQNENYGKQIEKFNTGEEDIVEALKPGVELAESFISKGRIDGAETLRTTQTDGDLELFAKGDRPFMLTGTWASPRLSGEYELDFEYEIYPYPVLDDGSVLVMDIATCVSVNADGENKDMAKAFVEYMTRPDVIWDYCDSQSSFSPLSGDGRLPSDKALAPQLPYLSNGRSVIGSNYNLELPLDDALYKVSLDMLGGLSAENAVLKLSGLL